MKRYSTIKCPRCGEEVKLPILWRCGLERVFYCDTCKLYFKLDYRLGAVVMAIALLAATVLFQLLGLLGGGFGAVMCLLFILPVFYLMLSIMRRFTLIVTTKLRLKRQNKRKDVI